jgi:hypothetical protein
VAGVVAFLAIYAGVQYFIARHQVIEFAKNTGANITEVRIYSVSCVVSDASIWIKWTFIQSGGPEPDLVITRTSWLGLGPTRIPVLRE